MTVLFKRIIKLEDDATINHLMRNQVEHLAISAEMPALVYLSVLLTMESLLQFLLSVSNHESLNVERRLQGFTINVLAK